MKSTLAAVKRQRFPARTSRQVRGLFTLGLFTLGLKSIQKRLEHVKYTGLFHKQAPN